MRRSILVVAAHPDDEVLGCGGTMAKHRAQGDDVHVLIMAEGITARDQTRNREHRNQDLFALNEMAQQVHTILNSTSCKLHDFPDNRMDSIDRLDVVKVIENVIQQHKPDTIYTHHAGDVNIDHRRTHEAVITACRPQPGHCVKRLLFFEVPSSTEWQPPHSAAYFMPTWFVDISETLSKKLDALKSYDSEMRNFPHPRSYKAVEALAQWRGATAGFESAEGFVLGRCLA